MTESSLRLAPPPDTLTVFLISSFTATPINSALTFWGNQLGLPAELSFASYGQVFQELQRHGRGGRPTADAVAVLLRMEDFIPTGRTDRAMSVAHDLTTTLAAAAQRSPGTTFLLAVCPPSSAARNDWQRLQSVDEATQALRHGVYAIANVAYVEPDDVIGRYRVSQIEDPYADSLGNIPYTPQYFAALGTALMRRLHRALTAEPKVLVVDGDNTLWDGILGGMGRLVSGSDSLARSYRTFCLSNDELGGFSAYAARMTSPTWRKLSPQFQVCVSSLMILYTSAPTGRRSRQIS
jgi:predicted enzyme involved in methoxymalonyl-ACP biosynthesis